MFLAVCICYNIHKHATLRAWFLGWWVKILVVLSRGLYYSYSGEVASLLNTPIFSKFIKNSTNFIKKLRSDKVGSNPTLPKGQKPK